MSFLFVIPHFTHVCCREDYSLFCKTLGMSSCGALLRSMYRLHAQVVSATRTVTAFTMSTHGDAAPVAPSCLPLVATAKQANNKCRACAAAAATTTRTMWPCGHCSCSPCCPPHLSSTPSGLKTNTELMPPPLPPQQHQCDLVALPLLPHVAPPLVVNTNQAKNKR